MTEYVDRHGRHFPQRPSPAPPAIVDPVVMQHAADKQEREYTTKLRRAALDFIRAADDASDRPVGRAAFRYLETREILRTLAEGVNLGSPSP